MFYSGQQRPSRMLWMPRREHEAARDWAFRTLSYNICSLRLLPGDIISMDIVASYLNLSRTPIHEACLLLQNRGLIEQSSRSKTVVSLIDMDQVRQSGFLVCCIEPWVLSSIPPEQKTVCRQQIALASKRLRSAQISQTRIDMPIELSESIRAQLYASAGMMHCWHMLHEASIAHRRAIMLALLLDEWIISPLSFELVSASLEHSLDSPFGPAATISNIMRSHMQALKRLEKHYPAYFIS